MEMDKKKYREKSTNKKKGLSYVTVTSADTKTSIISKINENVKRGISEGIEIGFIPSVPLPNVSFWVNTEDNRCGMTVTRDNGKWGWLFVDGTWKACSYLVGTGYDVLVFDDETNTFLAKKFVDCCGNKPQSSQVKTILDK